MKQIRIADKIFERFISQEEISEAVHSLAEGINCAYAKRERPLFLGVLNGAFVFTADLIRQINFPCEVSFIKMASYDGTASSGKISELIGLADDIRGRHVMIVEDIVDSGVTVEHLIRKLQEREPASVEVVTLLFKPDACREVFPQLRYGIAVPNDFIIGYGLDFNGFGRNLPDIYRLKHG